MPGANRVLKDLKPPTFTERVPLACRRQNCDTRIGVDHPGYLLALTVL